MDIKTLNQEFENSSLAEVLTFVFDTFNTKVVLASSLGLEDQLLTHYSMQVNKNARIFVLDTGRLNQETYDVMQKTRTKYNLNYEVYYPETHAVESLISKKGPNSFYESVENRKECCAIRKTEPLNRVLATVDAWITGLRKAQAITRADMALFEQDSQHNCIKINPLIKWSYSDVFEEIKRLNVPYNTLHDQGYPSVGCAPCTRAIKPGEDIRAGRWWWETPESKECGLHIVDGKIVPNRQKNNNQKDLNNDT